MLNEHHQHLRNITKSTSSLVARKRLNPLASLVTAALLVCGILVPKSPALADSWQGEPTAGGTVISGTVPGVRLTQVAAGANYSVALGSDGYVYGWGLNSSGQLGNGTTEATNRPVGAKTPSGLGFTQIAAGRDHTVALASDGSIYAWGTNSDGQLGDGTTTGSSTPVKVATPSGVTFTQVAAGDAGFTAALDSAGNAYAWGNNEYGQLGDGTTLDSSTVKKVLAPAGVSFTQIAVGGSHVVAVGSDGKTYAWGSNGSGRLGNGTMADSSTPVQVLMPQGVHFTQVSAGGWFSQAIGSDGKSYAWGSNLYGQLGNGGGDNSSTPVQVSTPAGVTFTTVISGYFHAMALDSNGHAYAWGYNRGGQLGNGTTTSSPIPVAVTMPPGVSFTQMGASWAHAVAVGSDQNVYTWGNNQYGALGDGTNVNTATPVVVPSERTVDEVLFGLTPGVNLKQSGDGWTVESPKGCGASRVTVKYTHYGVQHSMVLPNDFVQGTAPTITAQPTDVTTVVGDTASVTASATGDDIPVIQWQQASSVNGPWSDVPGGTHSTLSISATQDIWLRAAFTNCVSTTTSQTAKVVAADPGGDASASATPGDHQTSGSQGPATNTGGSVLNPVMGLAALASGLVASLVVGVTRRRARS